MRITGITGVADGAQAGAADGIAITNLAKETKTSLLAEPRGTAAGADVVDFSDKGRALAALAAAEGDGTGGADQAPAVQGGAGDQASGPEGSGTDDAGAMSLVASAGAAKAASGAASPSDTAKSTYEKILKEIQKLQEQIKEVENDQSLSEAQKRARVQELQQQILSLQSQLTKAKAMSKDDPLTYMGGTRAEGANFQMISHILPTDMGGGDA